MTSRDQKAETEYQTALAASDVATTDSTTSAESAVASQEQMMSNITPKIQEKIGINLHNQKNHPIEIIKNKIYSVFGDAFQKFDNLKPIVSTEDNFDKLLIPQGHPARSKSDTYYLNEDTVLRTHTSAHQNEILSKKIEKFLVVGDVYRKDEIDRCHYPVFHQMEGVALMEDGKDAYDDLVGHLTKLVNTLFPGCEFRINDDYFPFTHPSIEIEVKYNGEWLEILGAGVMQPKILENCGFQNRTAWAFGLGLERLAMILFKIPDIRLFWTEDRKFLDQFESGKMTEFKPYSKLDALTKDISFWIPDDDTVMKKNESEEKTEEKTWKNDNDFYEVCRDLCDDLIEEIELFDKFVHPKTQKLSHAYRIKYSPNDTKLNDPGVFTKKINDIHINIGKKVGEKLNVQIR